MSKHYFDFPEDIREKVRNHVERAIEGMSLRQFGQEAQYTAAMAGRLIGTAYDGQEGKVVFDATSFDDGGRASAESLFGADFAIQARVESRDSKVEKAIILQSKKGSIQRLPPIGRRKLERQIDKMRRITRSPKILEIDDGLVPRPPRVISANGYLQGRHYQRPSFPDYIVSKVLTTLDGDTREEFVDAVGDSSLSTLRILAFKS